MNLYLLHPITPWVPWYDKAFGFIVRAESEIMARTIADTQAGAENTHLTTAPPYTIESLHVWLDPELTSCVVLSNDGPAALILRNFASA